MIKEALEKLSYSIFPKRCELCGDVSELDQSRCEECRALQRVEGKLCEICGNPKDSCNCKDNKTKKPEYKAFIAPYYYENSIRAGANRFKDYGYPELAKAMAKEMKEHIDDNFDGVCFDCITFVPMMKKKEQKRGYNQAQLLANELSALTDIPALPLLEKIMKTPDQKRASAKQRAMNLHGAFDLKEGADVDEKTILLIDDVRTTGSTLNECAYVLNAYGANAVYATSFCMTKSKKTKKRKKK